MFSTRRFVSASSLLISIMALCGCGDGGPQMAGVEGTVTLDGKPLEKVLVEFWPESPGPRSFGETDASGHFKLMSDDGKREGAVVSSHKVILKDSMVLGDKFLGRAAENTDQAQGRKPRFGPKFSQTQTTPISKIVEANKKNEFALEVTK